MDKMKRETLSPTISALLQARALIDADWCQGFGHGGQVCAVEAIWRATEMSFGGRQEILGFLHRVLPARYYSVMSFNDAKGTTKADILALYDRAIDLAIKAEQ
jgi:hypothetical protein